MKKNFNVPFLTLKGEPCMVQGKDENGNEVEKPQLISEELGALFFSATGSNELPLSGDDKLRLAKVAQQMATHPDEVDVTSEDISLMKRVLERGCSAGAYLQIYNILEG